MVNSTLKIAKLFQFQTVAAEARKFWGGRGWKNGVKPQKLISFDTYVYCLWTILLVFFLKFFIFLPPRNFRGRNVPLSENFSPPPASIACGFKNCFPIVFTGACCCNGLNLYISSFMQCMTDRKHPLGWWEMHYKEIMRYSECTV